MERDKINIELKSEALTELIASPPFWLVRSGNILFFFVIVLVLVLSYLISYPDEIEGDVSLYRSHPPIEFQNHQYARLLQLNVKDGQKVKKQKVMALIDTEFVPNSKPISWIAPFDGEVLFNCQLNVSSFYRANQASLIFVPNGGEYKGVIKVAVWGSGKIEKGQIVFIELSDYPKNDYGMLEGKVKSITSVSKDNKYEVEVILPNQLFTTYKMKIPSKAILIGKARIITKNKKLLERLFEEVIDLF